MVLLRGVSPRGIVAALSVAAVACGCERDTVPPRAADAGASALGSVVSANVLSPAPRPRTDSLSDVAPRPPPSDHPYVGSTWASCTRGFRTSNQPQRDVTRLSLLCAPYHGMRRYGRTWFGPVSNGAPGTFEVRLAASQCARVFVTVGDDVHALRVSVLGPGGDVTGAAAATAYFVVVPEASAFCVERTGSYRVRIEVGSGNGLAAAELWTLPPK